MDKLVAKICADYRGFSQVEVYILNSMGEQIEVYTGKPTLLPIKIFNNILTASSTFYVFSTVGLQYNSTTENLVRNEFCWLTDPAPPSAESRTATSVTVTWEPVSFCGIEGELFFSSVNYILEAAEGYEWRNGMVRNFVPDVSDLEFKLVCRGNMLQKAEVTGLKPSTWYHFRVAIEYMGKRVFSESRAVPTNKTVPTAPGRPRAVVENIEAFKANSVGAKLNSGHIKISWSQSNSNGCQVERYQLQVLERHAGAASGISHVWGTNGHAETNEKTAVSNKWRNVYCNLSPEAFVQRPDDTVLDIRVRVRAKNSMGWSGFSEVLTINKRSHPSLFPTSFYPVELDASDAKDRSSLAISRSDNDIFTLYDSSLGQTVSNSPAVSRPNTSSPPRSPDGLARTDILSSSKFLTPGQRSPTSSPPYSRSNSPTVNENFLPGKNPSTSPNTNAINLADYIEEELDRVTTGLSVNREFVRNLIAPVIHAYSMQNDRVISR